jgi:fused signal recognition particle receptor
MTLSWFKRNKNKKKKPNDEAAAELPSSEEMASPQPPEIEQSLTDEADGPQSPEISVEDSDEEQQTTPDENPTAEIEVEPGSSPEQAKTGYFIRLRKRLSRTRKSLSSGFDRAFAGKKKIDDEVLEELEELLITSDIGVQTTMELIERISKAKVADVSEVKQILKDEIFSILGSQSPVPKKAQTKCCICQGFRGKSPDWSSRYVSGCGY